jgi:hypothetical protein
MWMHVIYIFTISTRGQTMTSSKLGTQFHNAHEFLKMKMQEMGQDEAVDILNQPQ